MASPSDHAHLQQPAGIPHAERRLRPQRDTSCTSITPTTAPRATAPLTCITFRAPSSTTAGAPRSPGATRSIPRHGPSRLGPDGNGGLVKVPGDFRELQGTMWVHDHRFFFTAENVYKGNLMMINYYSGPDRGNEVLNDGVNLRLPSGKLLDWGNIDFDVNLIVSDAALDQDGQLSSTFSPPTVSWATCRSSTSPMLPFSRCCHASTASASSTRACRGSSSWRSPVSTGAPCRSSSSPTTAISW